MALTWTAHRDNGGELSAETGLRLLWEEKYDVVGHVPTPGTPAWFDLIVDQPTLAPGTVHPTILSAYVTNFKVEPIGTTTGCYTVTVAYRNGDPRELDLPPLDRAAVIETATESLEVPTFTKANGDPWINTAGDLIAGLTKKKNRIIFSVQKNVSAIPAWTLSYADAVNSDAVNIRGLVVAAGYLLLSDLRIGTLTPETVNGLAYNYYPVSFTLTYDPDKWLTQVYNRGLYQINGDGDYVPCVDSEGEPVTEPAFLDANGLQLTYPVNPASIVTLEGQNHQEMPFSLLPLS